jgi:hypothetical protein
VLLPETEAQVSTKLLRKLSVLGIKSVKMNPTSQRGFPDRLLILPNGRVRWIELKAPGREKNLSAHQESQIAQLRALGHHVLVSSNADECIEWLRGLA